MRTNLNVINEKVEEIRKIFFLGHCNQYFSQMSGPLQAVRDSMRASMESDVAQILDTMQKNKTLKAAMTKPSDYNLDKFFQ